jgi:hypothetical protein
MKSNPTCLSIHYQTWYRILKRLINNPAVVWSTKFFSFWYFKTLIKRLLVCNYSKSYWNILLPAKVYCIVFFHVRDRSLSIYYTFLGVFYIDLAWRWPFRWNTFRFLVTNLGYNKVVALDWFCDFHIEVPDVNNTEKYMNLECRTFYFVKKLAERTAVGAVITIRYI